MGVVPPKPPNSVETNPAVLQYFIGKFNSKFNKIYRGLYHQKEVNIMSDKCPNCGADVSLSDPYRTAPPKMPEPILDPPKKIRWYEKMNWRNFFYNLWEYTVNIFWSLFVIGLAGIIIFFGVKWITSPDKVDYCYVTGSANNQERWVLKGHVPWSIDRDFGYFNNAYDAQQYSKKINCPLDISPLNAVPLPTEETAVVPADSGSNRPMAYPAPILPAQSVSVQPAPSASVPELLP